jgi:hypothetical protein
VLPLGLGGALRSSCTCQATQEERWPTGCERSDPRLEPFLRDLTRLQLQQMQGAGLPLGSGKPSKRGVVSQTENGAGLKRRCDGERPVCVARRPSAQRHALIAHRTARATTACRHPTRRVPWARHPLTAVHAQPHTHRDASASSMLSRPPTAASKLTEPASTAVGGCKPDIDAGSVDTDLC